MRKINNNENSNLISCTNHIDINTDMVCDSCFENIPLINYVEEKVVKAEEGVVILGRMPSKAVGVADEIEKETAYEIAKSYKNNIEEKDIVKALDLKVLWNEEKYQPEEINDKLTVKLSNLNLDEEKTYAMMHIKEDGSFETLPVNVLNNNEIEFKTKSFSTYILITVDTFTVTFSGDGNYKILDENGEELTDGASIADGTNFTFAVVPNDGYGVTSVTSVNSASESVVTLYGGIRRMTGIIESVTENLTVEIATTLAPKITTHPVNTKAMESTTAKFTVVAENATTYYWQYRTSKEDYWKAAGSTSATLSVTTSKGMSGYEYRCLVGNANFTYTERVVSDAVMLTVCQNPALMQTTSARVKLIDDIVITQHPVSVKVLENNTAKFTVSAVNASVYKWQYRESKEDYWKAAGSTSTTLSVTGVKDKSGYEYRCLVGDYTNHERVASDIAVLSVAQNPSLMAQAQAKVLDPIIFTENPISQKVLLGETATFTVNTDDATSYQWQSKASGEREWTNIDSATSKTLTVDTSTMVVDENFNITNNLSGTMYRVVAKNSSIVGYIEKSDPAILTVAQGEYVTEQIKVKPNVNNDSVTVEIEEETREYNGEQHTPTIVVKDGETPLTEGTDYTVSYGENIYPGTGTIIITGSGDYGGTRTEEFTITKANATLTPAKTSTSVEVTKSETISYEYNGDGKVTIQNSNSSVVTAVLDEDAKTITLTGLTTGNAVITISAAEGSNYNKATDASINVTVEHGNYTVNGKDYSTLLEAYNALKASGTSGEITVNRDIENEANSLEVEEGYTVLLNTNGNTINISKRLKNEGTLTINGGGKITAINNSDLEYLINNYGTLNINDVTLRVEINSNTILPCIMQYSGITNINGGTLEQVITENTDKTSAVIQENGGILNVNGGNIKVTKLEGISNNYGYTIRSNNATINIYDGIISAEVSDSTEGDNIFLTNSVLNMYDGTIESTCRYGIGHETSDTINIMGGKISAGAYAIRGNATAIINIGTSGDSVSTTSPELIGGTNAIKSDNGFSFYDGILKGGTAAIAGTAPVTEPGYEVYTEDSGKIAYLKKSAESMDVTLSENTFTYDGNDKTPDVAVTWSGDTLVENTDYTVTYSSNKDAGTATVTITGSGDYTGTKEVTFTINKADINPEIVMNDYVYGSTPTAPIVSGNSGNGEVTYYYNTENSNEGGTKWEDAESTTLLPGTYYMYAVVGETDNYTSAKTEPVEFVVASSTKEPTNFIASGDALLNMTLTFENQETDATIVLQVRNASGEFETLSENAVSPYVISDLEENTTYEYRIYAVKNGIESEYIYTTGHTPYADMDLIIRHDNTKPEFTYGSLSPDSEYITKVETLIFTFNVADKNYNEETSNLIVDDIIVKVDGTENTDVIKEITKVSIENGETYTLTMSNITGTGNVSVVIASGKITDKAGNANDEKEFDLNIHAMANPISSEAPTVDVTENTLDITSNQISIYEIEEVIYKYRESGDTEFIVADDSVIEDLKSDTYYEVITVTKDEKGNEQESEITVVKTEIMDITKITIEATPETLTSGDVTVTINYGGTNYIKEYSLDNENWTEVSEDEITIVVTSNKTVYARLKDNVKNSESVIYEIDYIDKEKPVIGEVTVEPEGNANKKVITVKDVEDIGVSGIKGYYISSVLDLDAATWAELTGTEFTYEVTENNTYYIWVSDNVGNISSAEIVNITGIVSAVEDVQVPTSIELTIGEEKEINLVYEGTPKNITFEIADEEIAEIEELIKTIKGVNSGETTLKVTIENYDGTIIEKEIKIIVSPLELTVELTSNGETYNGEWTKEDVVATLEVNGVLPSEYKEKLGEDGSWNLPENVETDIMTGITTITYNEDLSGDVYYAGYNKDGNIITTINGSHLIRVDKTMPKEGTANITADTNFVNIKVEGAEDTGAGIKEYVVNIYKDGELVETITNASGEITFENLTSSTEYSITYKVIDNVGNETKIIDAGTVTTKELIKKVTYVSFGETVTTKDVVAWQLVDLSLTVEKAGYEFKGWSKEERGEILESLVMPEEDITLYAVLKDEVPPTVTDTDYETNDGDLELILKPEDEGSGPADYAVTTDEETPNEWFPIEEDENGEVRIVVPGTNKYYVWIRDLDGNYVRYEQVAIKDIYAPTGTIKVSGDFEVDGLPYSNDHEVVINITASDNECLPEEIEVAVYNEEDYINIKDYSQITWLTNYNKDGLKLDWETTAGDGLKRIYIILKDKAGNISMTIKDIELATAEYKIHYYVQNIDGNGYTLKETVTTRGRTNEELALFDIAKTIKGTDYEKASLTLNGEDIGSTYTVSSDGTTEIYLYYLRNKMTITLNATSGDVTPNEVSIVYGDVYGNLPEATRRGYKFIGWYTAEEVGTEVLSTDIVEASKTLYAHWEELPKYTVTLNANSGTVVPETIDVYYSQNYGELPVPTNGMYTFAGWYTQLEGGVKVDSETIVELTENTTLYARWELKDVVLTFKLEDGTVVETIEAKPGSEITAPAVTKEGHTFKGWSPALPSTAPSEDTTYTATWSAKTYTITFNSNGGQITNLGDDETWRTVTYGTAYGTLPTSELKGYTFVGWFTEADGGEQITEETIVSASPVTKLYAHWTPNEYTVTLNPNGGTVDPTTVTVYYGGTYGELPTPEKEGYNFLGWYTSQMDGTKIESTTKYMLTYNRTIYAMWEAKTYTVTLNLNDGEGTTETMTVTHGGTYANLPEPERDGYTFLGWFTEASGGTQVESTSTVTTAADGQTLWAMWEEAIAIYSATDGSLTFLRTSTNIKSGDTYNEKEVTAVYTGIETTEYYLDTNTGKLNLPGWLENSGSILSVHFEDEITPISTVAWFSGFNNCTSIDLTNLNIKNVKDMSHMFSAFGYNAETVTLNLNSLNASNVTNMSYMFNSFGYNAKTVTLNLNSLNTSNVTNMSYMFNSFGYNAETVTVNLSNWNTSNVIDMNSMFADFGGEAATCTLEGLENWNTSSVIDMSNMFRYICQKATCSLDCSNWNVEKVTSYDYFNYGSESKVTAPTWVN